MNPRDINPWCPYLNCGAYNAFEAARRAEPTYDNTPKPGILERAQTAINDHEEAHGYKPKLLIVSDDQALLILKATEGRFRKEIYVPEDIDGGILMGVRVMRAKDAVVL